MESVVFPTPSSRDGARYFWCARREASTSRAPNAARAPLVRSLVSKGCLFDECMVEDGRTPSEDRIESETVRFPEKALHLYQGTTTTLLTTHLSPCTIHAVFLRTQNIHSTTHSARLLARTSGRPLSHGHKFAGPNFRTPSLPRTQNLVAKLSNRKTLRTQLFPDPERQTRPADHATMLSEIVLPAPRNHSPGRGPRCPPEKCIPNTTSTPPIVQALLPS